MAAVKSTAALLLRRRSCLRSLRPFSFSSSSRCFGDDVDAGGDDRDLAIRKKREKMEMIRSGAKSPGKIRQHVNPLSLKFQRIPSPPDYAEMFARDDLPLHLDLGSGKGSWLCDIAKGRCEKNHLGIEIREALAARAQLLASDAPNCAFLFGNVNVSIKALLSQYPGTLDIVSINNPDPHFKKKHWKRRIVNRALVQDLAEFQPPGGILYIQSDIASLVDDMTSIITEQGLYKQVLRANELRQELDPAVNMNAAEAEGIKCANPFGFLTEREAHVLDTGGAVRRAAFHRTDISHVEKL